VSGTSSPHLPVALALALLKLLLALLALKLLKLPTVRLLPTATELGTLADEDDDKEEEVEANDEELASAVSASLFLLSMLANIYTIACCASESGCSRVISLAAEWWDDDEWPMDDDERSQVESAQKSREQSQANLNEATLPCLFWCTDSHRAHRHAPLTAVCGWVGG
jgi:hypothetical protein